MSKFRDAFAGFVVASMLLATVAVFEYLKHWLLYSSLPLVLGVQTGYFNYLGRAGGLRALGTTGQPIPLGYALMVGLGFFYLVRSYVPNRIIRSGILALLAAGLFASLSRGPWVGMLVFFIIFYCSGPNVSVNLLKFGFAFLLLGLAFLMLPSGDKILDFLPFIGSVDTESVDYRSRLLDMGLIVVDRNPWFGSINYLATPEMQSMRQGQGIIDLVNSYLGITLQYGLVGLGLFSSIFVAVFLQIFKAGRKTTFIDNEQNVLRSTLLSVLVAILVVIYTVSSISVIPTIYWAVAGMGVAYTNLICCRGDVPTSIRDRPSSFGLTG